MDGIIGIAELCQTSLTATAIHYADFCNKTLIVILSTDGIIDFCIVSEKTRFMKDKEIPQRGWPVPKKSATETLAKERNRILNCERDSMASDLSDWIETGKTQDALEEVIGLGRYGKILTVIST